MKTSETTTKILPALLAVQGDVGNVQRNADNPHFRSRYVTLDAVLAAVRAPLTKAGVIILQDPHVDGATVTVTTRLFHTSGEWVENTCTATAGPDKRGNVGVQQIGSTITYLRRYALMALFAVAPTDDDGNSGQGDPAGYERRKHREAMEKAETFLMGHGLLAEAQNAFDVDSLTELPPNLAGNLKTWTREAIIRAKAEGGAE